MGETELGAQAPMGFWDPLGFCEDEEKFKDLRAKELKHGRLAMMGAVGMLTQSIVQVPGMEGVPKNVSAIANGNGLVGGVAIFAIIGLLEAVVFVQDPKKSPAILAIPCRWSATITPWRCAQRSSTMAGWPWVRRPQSSLCLCSPGSPPSSSSDSDPHGRTVRPGAPPCRF